MNRNKKIETLLESSVGQDINKILTEELTISEDVIVVTNDIANQIFEFLKNTTTKKEKDDNNITKITTNESLKTTISFEGIEYKLSIYITGYNFKNKEEYLHNQDKYFDILNNGGSSFNKERNRTYCMMFLNLGFISGTPIKDYFLDTLQHEIEHLYQQIKTNQLLPVDSYNYNIAYHSLNINNDIIRLIGQIIYYSSPFEQDGYVNGLYAYMQEQNKPLDYSDLIETPTILGYKLLKDSVKSLYGTNKEEINKILNKYYKKIDYDKLLEIGIQGIRRFIIKIGKSISKHNKEMIEKGWRK